MSHGVAGAWRTLTVPYVMAQAGHTDPKVTLSIYAQVMFRGDGEREALGELVGGTTVAIEPARAEARD